MLWLGMALKFTPPSEDWVKLGTFKSFFLNQEWLTFTVRPLFRFRITFKKIILGSYSSSEFSNSPSVLKFTVFNLNFRTVLVFFFDLSLEVFQAKAHLVFQGLLLWYFSMYVCLSLSVLKSLSQLLYFFNSRSGVRSAHVWHSSASSEIAAFPHLVHTNGYTAKEWLAINMKWFIPEWLSNNLKLGRF